MPRNAGKQPDEPHDQGTLDGIMEPTLNVEEALTARAHGVTLATLQDRTDQAIAIVDARMAILTRMRRATIVMTAPQNWTKTKLEDGTEVASLRADGAYSVMDIWGIEVYNLRGPDGAMVSEPVAIMEKDGSWTTVIIGDARSRFTGRIVEGIRAARNSKEKFVGRSEGKARINDAVALADQRKATRTLLDNTAVRVMTGTSKVPLETLKECGLDVAKCVAGYGFGSSAERKTDREIPQALLDAALAFWNNIVSYCAGDANEALKVLVEVSQFTEKDKDKKPIMIDGKPKMKQPQTWRSLVTSGTDAWLKSAIKRFDERLAKEDAAQHQPGD